MASRNTFADARIQIAGIVGGHLMFRVDRSEGPALFGEYFDVFGGDGYDLSIEIGDFGFANRESAGSRHPLARAGFSAEECSSVKQLIQSYFSNPSVALETWRGVPDVKFLGDVRFRPDWIIVVRRFYFVAQADNGLKVSSGPFTNVPEAEGAGEKLASLLRESVAFTIYETMQFPEIDRVVSTGRLEPSWGR
jgi:hypothetical protein